MKQGIKDQLSMAIIGLRLPRYQEIPNVGLYLEQTVKYINECLLPLTEEALTPSMVSNYVKKGLIARSVKKLYYREQIAYLIFITFAKNVLSMDNIRLLFDIKNTSYASKKAYDYFRLELLNILEYVFEIKENLETVGYDHTYEKMLLRNTIVSVSHKLYLEKVFNEVRILKTEKSTT